MGDRSRGSVSARAWIARQPDILRTSDAWYGANDGNLFGVYMRWRFPGVWAEWLAAYNARRVADTANLPTAAEMLGVWAEPSADEEEQTRA